MNTIFKSSALSLLSYILLSTSAPAAGLLGLGGGSGGVLSQNSDGSLGVLNNTVTIGGDGTGASGSAAVSVGITGGSSGGLGNLVSVANSPGNGTTVNLLNGASGHDPAASVNLNLGNRNGPDASVNLLPNTLGTNGVTATVDLDDLTDGTAGPLLDANVGNTLVHAVVDLNASPDVLVSLFGGTTGAGGTDVSVDLFGNGGGGSGTGGDGVGIDAIGPGGNGDPTGSGGGTVVIPINGLGGSGGMQTASIDRSGPACFTPNADQLATLAGRHAYNDATFSSWVNVKALKIVRVDLCTSALKRIAGQGNIARLQTFVNGNAVLKASLHQQGLSASRVIGADRQGNALVIYVS